MQTLKYHLHAIICAKNINKLCMVTHLFLFVVFSSPDLTDNMRNHTEILVKNHFQQSPCYRHVLGHWKHGVNCL